MDIQLAKTFLEIMSAGSFLEAAKRLHITQTTVTARIKNLEHELGCQLFIRNRSGAKLTAEGERFVEPAKQLLRTWHQAKLDLLKTQRQSNELRVGVEPSLWNPLMIEAVKLANQEFPHLMLEIVVQGQAELFSRLHDDKLDAVMAHSPHYHSRFVSQLLMEEKLIHVASCKEYTPNIFVDWGEEFRSQYDAVLSQHTGSTFKTDLGPLALKFMLEQGGNGYFRSRVVKPYLQSKQLMRVESSPEFSYPVFLMYGFDAPPAEALSSFIRVLKTCCDNLEYWSV